MIMGRPDSEINRGRDDLSAMREQLHRIGRSARSAARGSRSARTMMAQRADASGFDQTPDFGNNSLDRGGMAEWLKAAVLKTAFRYPRNGG